MTHEFSYTATNEEKAYTPPDITIDDELVSTPTARRYNRDGQLTEIERPDGAKLQIMYDFGTGRYDHTDYLAPDAAEPIQLIVPDYEELGNRDLKSLTYGDETLSFSWYEDGLKKSETWAGTVNGTIRWNYDLSRRLEQLVIGESAPIIYAYDDFQRITDIGALGMTYHPTDLDNLTYSAGKLDTVTIGTAVTEFALYDPKGIPGRVHHRAAGGDLLSFEYQRTNDRITYIQGNNPSQDRQYTYDRFGRLTKVQDGNGATVGSYWYDENGNRTFKQSLATGQVTASYNAQDQLTRYGTTTYRYTRNGDLETKTTLAGITTYRYNALGNLDQVILPNNSVIGYTYDAQGRLIAKRVNGGVVERFIYQDQLNPVAKVDEEGNVLELYVYAEKEQVPSYMVKGGTTYRVISDHLGSVRMVVDAQSGTVAQEIAYDEFGTVLSDSNPGFQPFGFAGGVYDLDTKLVKFGARDYDPEVGRWIEKDPIMFDGGLNHYAYANNDPVNKIDITGEKPGDLFDTAEQAAHDAAFFTLNTFKDAPYVEYLAEIYTEKVNGEEKYKYERPYKGLINDRTEGLVDFVEFRIKERGKNFWGIWHSHVRHKQRGYWSRQKGEYVSEWEGTSKLSGSWEKKTGDWGLARTMGMVVWVSLFNSTFPDVAPVLIQHGWEPEAQFYMWGN